LGVGVHVVDDEPGQYAPVETRHDEYHVRGVKSGPDRLCVTVLYALRVCARRHEDGTRPRQDPATEPLAQPTDQFEYELLDAAGREVVVRDQEQPDRVTAWFPQRRSGPSGIGAYRLVG